MKYTKGRLNNWYERFYFASHLSSTFRAQFAKYNRNKRTHLIILLSLFYSLSN